jgi:hypothetical protein
MTRTATSSSFIARSKGGEFARVAAREIGVPQSGFFANAASVSSTDDMSKASEQLVLKTNYRIKQSLLSLPAVNGRGPNVHNSIATG